MLVRARINRGEIVREDRVQDKVSHENVATCFGLERSKADRAPMPGQEIFGAMNTTGKPPAQSRTVPRTRSVISRRPCRCFSRTLNDFRGTGTSRELTSPRPEMTETRPVGFSAAQEGKARRLWELEKLKKIRQ